MVDRTTIIGLEIFHMTKNDAMALNIGDAIRVKSSGAMDTVWKKPSADPSGNVIVWFSDGNEWGFHSDVDKMTATK